jgi:hypothetical protein
MERERKNEVHSSKSQSLRYYIIDHINSRLHPESIRNKVGRLLLVLNQSPSGNQYSVWLVRGNKECFAQLFFGLSIWRAKKAGDPTAPSFLSRQMRFGRFVILVALRAGWKNSQKIIVLAHLLCRPAFWAGSRSGKVNSYLSAPLVGTRTPLPAPLVPPGRVRTGVVCELGKAHSIGREKRS